MLTDQSSVEGRRGIPCGRADRHADAHDDIQPRRGGAPFGNSNRLVHGLRSRRYREGRRLALASLKLLHHLAYRVGVVEGRNRARPLRADQLGVLAIHEPELLALAQSMGIVPAAWKCVGIIQ